MFTFSRCIKFKFYIFVLGLKNWFRWKCRVLYGTDARWYHLYRKIENVIRNGEKRSPVVRGFVFGVGFNVFLRVSIQKRY